MIRHLSKIWLSFKAKMETSVALGPKFYTFDFPILLIGTLDDWKYKHKRRMKS